MALVNLKNMLEDARKNKYAVPAFDVSNHDMARAVIEVAEELKSPVILMGLKPDLAYDKLDCLVAGIKIMAEKVKVPVCLHLDHAVDFDLIKRAVDCGFTSVMYDGSVLPLEENIKNTKRVVDYAHEFGVTVEAELGHVGDGIVGNSETGLKKSEGDNPDDYLTNPEELEYFLKSTNVDTIAVAIGTAHGVYVHEPKLHFDRLEELNKISTVPMVMHGGSGTPDDQVKRSIELGICKINIFSEIISAFFGALKVMLNNNENMAIWPSTAYEQPLIEMKKVIKNKILLLGSNDRA